MTNGAPFLSQVWRRFWLAGARKPRSAASHVLMLVPMRGVSDVIPHPYHRLPKARIARRRACARSPSRRRPCRRGAALRAARRPDGDDHPPGASWAAISAFGTLLAAAPTCIASKGARSGSPAQPSPTVTGDAPALERRCASRARRFSSAILASCGRRAPRAHAGSQRREGGEQIATPAAHVQHGALLGDGRREKFQCRLKHVRRADRRRVADAERPAPHAAPRSAGSTNILRSTLAAVPRRQALGWAIAHEVHEVVNVTASAPCDHAKELVTSRVTARRVRPGMMSQPRECGRRPVNRGRRERARALQV